MIINALYIINNDVDAHGVGGKTSKKNTLVHFIPNGSPSGGWGETQNYGANIKNTPPQYKSLF